MKSVAILLACILAPLTLGACARHVVVERSFGRIDGDRGISTNSDLEWTIQHEPSKDAGEKH